ncbi:hypothetical protein JCM3765_005299 [Sporobolomyces pararoseus]
MSKRRRVAAVGTEEKSYNSTSDLVALLESSSTNSRPSSFSPTANLIAVAGLPSQSSSTSDSILFSPSPLAIPEPRQPLAIHLTYLSGPSSASIPRLNFRLQLPLLPPSLSITASNEIKLLSFSPDGAYLLSVSGSTDAENDGTDDYLTVFEQSETGCIDQWNMVLHEQAARFGARGNGTATTLTSGADGKEVMSVRWVGEPRSWYPNPEYSNEDENKAGQKPFSCAPPRSSPLSGAAFVAVLSSDEIVFVHLPRTSPLLPNIVCMPLHPPPSALASPFSKNSDLPEVTALSPSRRALSLTAVPTPPTSLSTTIDSTLPMISAGGILPVSMNNGAVPGGPVDQPTPTSHISQLVGSLVSTLPSLDASLPLPVAPSPAAGAGNAALKEELRAAELANSIDGESPNGTSKRRRRIRLADVGAVRGSRMTSEAGSTTFLVATLTRRSRSKPRRPLSSKIENSASSTQVKQEPSNTTAPQAIPETTTNIVNDLGLNMNLDEENFDLAALDGFDFTSLDAAFGSSSDTAAKPTTTVKDPSSPEKKGPTDESGDDVAKDWEEWEKKNADSQGEEEEGEKDQWKVELSEVNIDMLNADGPRLTVKPQPHFYASPPTFSSDEAVGGDAVQIRDASITHLVFLEDNQLPVNETSSTVGSESSVDLRLLAVSTSCSNYSPQTSLASYDFSNESYALSDAFSHLECRKADVQTVNLGEWSTRFVSEAALPPSMVLTAISPRSNGRELGTFLAVVAESKNLKEKTEEAKWKSKVTILSSETLQSVESQTETILPDSSFYSSVVLSPNAAVVVCLPRATLSSGPRPVIAASPFATQDCATRIALSLIKQSDSTDVSGVAMAGKEDSQSLYNLLDSTHSLVQAQLPPNRPLFNTSIQFDLLGIAASLLASSNPSDSQAKTKIETAQGLIDCAAALRAFTKVEKKQQGSTESAAAYRCETDALWPLVGHSTWYSEFVERLIRDVLRSASGPPSPLLLHFLHPLARSLHTRLFASITGFSSTLSTLAASPEAGMSVAEQEMMDLASQVVKDAVRGGFESWKTLMEDIADVERSSFGSSLSTVTIPQTFYPHTTSVISFLREAYPDLAPSAKDSLPSPPTSPAFSAVNELDAIRKCQLPASKSQSTFEPQPSTQMMMMKQCSRCGKKTGAVSAAGVEGVWANFEECWRSKCACGGLWRTL